MTVSILLTWNCVFYFFLPKRKNSLGRGGPVQKGPPDDSALGGRRGNRDSVAADPAGTSGDFLEQTKHNTIR